MPNSNQINREEDFSIKSYFLPLTTFKVIHIIFFIGILVYANMMLNNFLWDDISFIVENADIKTISISKIFGASLFNSDFNYRPIPALYFSLLYAIFNDTTFFYHLFQLLLHIINSCLLFLLYKRFINMQLSLFLSLIFLVHPIQVESVSYIAASVNQLLFLFGIGALLLDLEKKYNLKKILFVFILLLIALLTKETAILFVFVIIVYKFFSHRLVDTNKTIYLLGSFTLLITYLSIRFLAIGVTYNPTSILPIVRQSFLERLLNIPAILNYYFTTFINPSQVAFNQQWIVTSPSFSSFYFPLITVSFVLLLFLVFGLYLFKVRKNAFKSYIFFLSWFIGGMMLHLQLVPLNATVADRWFYLPLAGLLGILGVLVSVVSFHSKKIAYIGYIVAFACIFFLGIQTMIRNTHWINAISLYNADKNKNNNFIIELYIGGEYYLQQNYKEALIHYKKSSEMFTFESNLNNVAYMYELQGNKEEAKKYYYKALNAKLYYKTGHTHLLTTYIRLGRIFILEGKNVEAQKILLAGLKDFPDESYMWALVALNENQMQNNANALIAAQKAVDLYSGQEQKYIYTEIFNGKKIQLSKENTNVRWFYMF